MTQQPGPDLPPTESAEPHDASTPPAATPAPRHPDDPLRGSRTSGVWAAVVLSVVVLVLLVVFIVQNTQSVRIAFFGWDGEAPLAAALLAATAAGMVLTGVAGSLRILQLRRRVRRERR